MRKLLLILVCGLSLLGYAQSNRDIVRLNGGGTLPSSCRIGDTFFLVTVSGANAVGLYECLAANTWTSGGPVVLADTPLTTRGDLLTVDSTPKLVRLAAGGANTVLHGGTDLSYGAVDLAADVTGQLPISRVGSAGLSATAPATISAAGVIANGLASVTNDVQTKAAIVPNTVPTAGQVLVGNAGGTAYAPVSLSGSGVMATLSAAGVLTLGPFTGQTQFADGTAALPSITFSGGTTGFHRLGGSLGIDGAGAGAEIFNYDAAGQIKLRSDGHIDFSSSTTLQASNTDTAICRGSAGVINIGTTSGDVGCNTSGTLTANIVNAITALQQNGVQAALGSTAFLTSNYTNATTTFSSVAGLSFTVSASKNYKIRCDLDYQTSAATADVKIQWTGPASPTAVTYDLVTEVTGSTLSAAVATAFSSSLSETGTPTTATNFPLTTTLTLINGANAGTVQLQAAATGVGTITIIPGSCSLQQ